MSKYYVQHCTYDDFYSNYYSERAKSDPDQIETDLYNAALAITGCIRGTSREKLYSELGLTSLYDRRRFHRLNILGNLSQILFAGCKLR